jgi:hypothetical protein
MYGTGRLRWPRGLRHELSSPARTLGSGFESHSWHGCLRLFSVCAVLRIGSGLGTGWSPVQGLLQTVYIGLWNWKSGQDPTKGCRAIDGWMNEWIIYNSTLYRQRRKVMHKKNSRDETKCCISLTTESSSSARYWTQPCGRYEPCGGRLSESWPGMWCAHALCLRASSTLKMEAVKLLWNVCEVLPEYTVSHPRKQCYSYPVFTSLSLHVHLESNHLTAPLLRHLCHKMQHNLGKAYYDCQEIPRLLRNRNVYYRVYNSPLLAPILTSNS